MQVKILENITEPEQPPESNETNGTIPDLCDGVICETYNLTCPDGFVAECTGSCNPETGECIECTPSCEGHEIPGPGPPPNCTENWTCSEWSKCENGTQTRSCFDVNNCTTEQNKPTENQTCMIDVCNLTCAECEYLDEVNCSCIPISVCISNDSCCPAGCDYLNDSDCLPPAECSVDADCDDGNACTTDTCSVNGTCSNIEIIPCCGNGVCEASENGTSCPADCKEIPRPEGPELSLEIISPKKVTRGKTATLTAVVENSGDEAKNIVLEWILPEFFEIVTGNRMEEIGILDTNSSFSSEMVVESRLDANLGINEIKVRVSYE